MQLFYVMSTNVIFIILIQMTNDYQYFN